MFLLNLKVLKIVVIENPKKTNVVYWMSSLLSNVGINRSSMQFTLKHCLLFTFSLS